jgi:hypothetical protein
MTETRMRSDGIALTVQDFGSQPAKALTLFSTADYMSISEEPL